jgi:hypothetical protein
MTHKVLSEDDIRALCNEDVPAPLLGVVLSLLQRITIALEEIAEQGKPVTLMEERPHKSE